MCDRRGARDRCLRSRGHARREDVMQLPPAGRADCDPGKSRGDAEDSRTPRHRRQREPLRHRLVENGGIQLAQPVCLRPVACDPRRFLWVCSQVRLDLGAPPLGQPPIDIALKVGFGERTFAHLITCKRPDAGNPSISARSFSRPRDRRDMTVPIGMPSVRATSS